MPSIQQLLFRSVHRSCSRLRCAHWTSLRTDDRRVCCLLPFEVHIVWTGVIRGKSRCRKKTGIRICNYLQTVEIEAKIIKIFQCQTVFHRSARFSLVRPLHCLYCWFYPSFPLFFPKICFFCLPPKLPESHESARKSRSLQEITDEHGGPLLSPAFAPADDLLSFCTHLPFQHS